MSLISKLGMLGAASSGGAEAKYLITYEGSGKVWDIENDFADVTSTFKPSNTTSWAGSDERLYNGWQDNGYRSKYIGFGGWGRDGSIGGAIWDVNNASSQWTGYNNYDGTALNFGGSGNAIVTRIVPHGNSGNFFWFRINDNLEVGVNRITNPSSSNVGSQASQLTNTGTRPVGTWGDYIVSVNSTTLYLSSFNQSTGATSNISSASIASFESKAVPEISKTGNVIAVVDGGANNTSSVLKVWDDHNITEYDGSTKVLGSGTSLIFPSAVRSAVNSLEPEALAISDDDRWIAASYRRSTSPYYGIVVFDRNNSYATTVMTLPVGAGSNSRPKDIVFFPDNDTFFMSGYANAQCLLCSASQGTYTRNFGNYGANKESLMSSSMGATVLPPDWTNGY
jgi:hypothetical protein